MSLKKYFAIQTCCTFWFHRIKLSEKIYTKIIEFGWVVLILFRNIVNFSVRFIFMSKELRILPFVAIHKLSLPFQEAHLSM